MRNIALRLSYDGTAYHGWQVQKTEKTVAETLEKALSAVCGEKVHVTGCGRTDAGVHAMRYCANFRTGSRIPIHRLPLAVNTRLPMDIAVQDAVEVDEDFNAIGSCKQKEYIYRIFNSRIRDPSCKTGCASTPRRWTLTGWRGPAGPLRGRTTSPPSAPWAPETKTTVRTVHWCRATRDGERIEIAVCADGFSHNMVRAIVGTMVYAAMASWSRRTSRRCWKRATAASRAHHAAPGALYVPGVVRRPAGEMMNSEPPARAFLTGFSFLPGYAGGGDDTMSGKIVEKKLFLSVICGIIGIALPLAALRQCHGDAG